MTKKKKDKRPRYGRCLDAGYKVKFPSRKAAEEELRYRQALHSGEKVPVRVYRCPKCKKFHLTSMQKLDQVNE